MGINQELIGPSAVKRSAKLYLTHPESLSSETRMVLGYVYRDYLLYTRKENESISFSDFALCRWVDGELPMDALV